MALLCMSWGPWEDLEQKRDMVEKFKRIALIIVGE